VGSRIDGQQGKLCTENGEFAGEECCLNPKSTLKWAIFAVALFAFIFFYQRRVHNAPATPVRVLSNFKAAAVTRVKIQPLGGAQLVAERTNGGWRLTEPLSYPAQTVSIETLLSSLEGLVPLSTITPRELKEHPQADMEYGFTSPQTIILFEQGDAPGAVIVGAKTAPGDQVFVRVGGMDGVCLVDAELLKLVPRSANDWRDTTLINLNGLAFDRISVTNGPKIFELRRDTTNRLWRMVVPNPARADNARIKDSLQKLHALRILDFVTDDPKADLEALGLRPAELDVALSQGTNLTALLQFGKSPTNDPTRVYARRAGQDAIVTVSNDLLAPWRAKVNDFRDVHLVELAERVSAIEVRAGDNFSLMLQASNTWRIVPQNLPGDAALINEMLSRLSNLEIIEFVKDVVTEPDLAGYGLAAPARQYILRNTTNSSPTAAGTNLPIVDLQFGTNREDKVYARRTDENSVVYAVKRADVEVLPSMSWQLRDRQVWNFSENDVARVTIRQQGKTRQIIRNSQYNWSLAPGSQGIINGLPEEETVRGLCRMAAAVWTARGEKDRSKYGFTDNGHQITIELKSGEKVGVEFGGTAPSGFPYAAIAQNGEQWVFEFPLALYYHVQSYLSIPANTP